MAEASTLFLRLTDGAALSLIELAVWERERVADALLLPMIEPRRKPLAERLADDPGEAYVIWIGEKRTQYKVYKDDHDKDIGVVVYAVF